MPENSESTQEVTQEQAELSEQYRDIAITNSRHVIHCLSIIGQIEGHYILPPQNKTTKYEHIMPALVAIEQDKSIEGLIIIINTVGGDVEAGLALAELISSMKTPTVSIVVGGGTLHRRAAGSERKALVYSQVSNYDGSSRPPYGACSGSAANAFLF